MPLFVRARQGCGGQPPRLELTMKHRVLRVSLGMLVFSFLAHADKILVNRSVSSPVFVSNSAMHELMGTAIGVRNRSDKKIRKITVEVRRKNPGQADTVTVEDASVELSPGESGRATVPYQQQAGSSEVTITVIGVEHADGTRWTIPKT
jgi:hypothetical protein